MVILSGSPQGSCDAVPVYHYGFLEAIGKGRSARDCRVFERFARVNNYTLGQGSGGRLL